MLTLTLLILFIFSALAAAVFISGMAFAINALIFCAKFGFWILLAWVAYKVFFD